MNYQAATYVGSVTVIDPDSGGEVELAIYKQYGANAKDAIVAVDASWLEQVGLDTDDLPPDGDLFDADHWMFYSPFTPNVILVGEDDQKAVHPAKYDGTLVAA